MFEFMYNINPIAFTLGGFDVYWYAIMYILGFLCVRVQLQRITEKYEFNVGNLLNYIAMGVIVGGKIGNWLLYSDFYSLFDRGGMSFYGGMVGVIVGCYIFCYRQIELQGKLYRLLIFELKQRLLMIVPWCLMLGRIGNVINNEMPGKAFDGIWAVQQDILRHPVSVYQAIAEGPILWMILNCYKRKSIVGFVIWYCILRIITECFKDQTVLIRCNLWWIVMYCILLIGMNYWYTNECKKSSIYKNTESRDKNDKLYTSFACFVFVYCTIMTCIMSDLYLTSSQVYALILVIIMCISERCIKLQSYYK